MELGCGGGRFLRGIAAARPALRLVGIDLSQRALAVARERTPGVEFRRVETPTAPLPGADGEFDGVCILDVLEHVVDPAATLAEVQRVLRPGGLFHLHVPCEGDVRSLWRWIPGQRGPRGLKRRLGGHLQAFRRRDVRALLAAAGFEVRRERNSLHLAGNVADVGLFAGLALLRRMGRARTTTSGSVIAAAAGDEGREKPGALAVRAVDRILWFEARLLGRVPSWSVHLTCQRT
jgi:SAM-dependent methyltransferase